MRKLYGALAGAALFASPLPANAALLNFSLTGDYEASWQLDSNPVPDAYSTGFAFVIYDVEGSFPGSLIDVVDLYFYNGDVDGGLGIDDYYGETTLLVTDGPQLYTGPESAPVFHVGTYSLSETGGTGSYVLTISSATPAPVPEAATWMLMLTGFGAVGYSLRRRRTTLSLQHV